MSRAVSNRLKFEGSDFIQLESNSANFRLLTEQAPGGTSSTDKSPAKYAKLGNIRTATSTYR